MWVAECTRNPRPAEAGPGRLQQDVEPVARDRQRAWPTPDLAVLVDDPDGEPAGGHAVVFQLLDQPLEVADQPGVEDDGLGGRLAEAAAARQGLVSRAPGGSAGRPRR